jgi:peptidoglycan/LPS O-acetylase OafA/YrhL
MRDGRWTVVAAVSVALLFFSVPHTLEDFALGEPLKRGVPPAAIAFVVSSLLAAQALGLYWVAQRRARGLWVHAVLGLLWAVAAGVAQLPELTSTAPYRSGFLSAAWVLGIITLGAALLLSSLAALWAREPRSSR